MTTTITIAITDPAITIIIMIITVAGRDLRVNQPARSTSGEPA